MNNKIRTAVLLMLTLAPACLRGQAVDSAARAVDTYLRILNPEGLPADSVLLLETTITTHGSADTIRMRRWYAQPEQFRVEVEQGDYLQTALYCNGTDRFRQFNPHTGEWTDLERSHFLHHLSGYDFRTPLHGWRQRHDKLTWCGHTELKGQRLAVVKVESTELLDRYYMFDPSNGLLTLVIENAPEDNASYRQGNASHIEWKTYHEYLPVGTSLVCSQESFMRDGRLTILNTTARLLPRNERLFNHD